MSKFGWRVLAASLNDCIESTSHAGVPWSNKEAVEVRETSQHTKNCVPTSFGAWLKDCTFVLDLQ